MTDGTRPPPQLRSTQRLGMRESCNTSGHSHSFMRDELVAGRGVWPSGQCPAKRSGMSRTEMPGENHRIVRAAGCLLMSLLSQRRRRVPVHADAPLPRTA